MRDTKLKGDIAEHTFAVKAMQRGWRVALPLGDRVPYDVILDIEGVLVRVQVKSAWYEAKNDFWVTSCRRAKTNRRHYKFAKYADDDFDFAAVYLDQLDIFYILPVQVFNSWAAHIAFVEGPKRQRPPRSAPYREAWHLFEEFLHSGS